MNFITSNYLEAIPESCIFAKIKLKNSKRYDKEKIHFNFVFGSYAIIR